MLIDPSTRLGVRSWKRDKQFLIFNLKFLIFNQIKYAYGVVLGSWFKD